MGRYGTAGNIVSEAIALQSAAQPPKALNSRLVGNPYRIVEGLPVNRLRLALTARIDDYIVRTARNRALPSATRS